MVRKGKVLLVTYCITFWPKWQCGEEVRSTLLKPKSDKVRQTDCRAEIWLGMCVESHLDKPLDSEGILLCRLDPRKRSVTYVVMDDETSV